MFLRQVCAVNGKKIRAGLCVIEKCISIFNNKLPLPSEKARKKFHDVVVLT
jgi:hypothetical protein